MFYCFPYVIVKEQLGFLQNLRGLLSHCSDSMTDALARHMQRLASSRSVDRTWQRLGRKILNKLQFLFLSFLRLF